VNSKQPMVRIFAVLAVLVIGNIFLDVFMMFPVVAGKMEFGAAFNNGLISAVLSIIILVVVIWRNTQK